MTTVLEIFIWSNNQWPYHHAEVEELVYYTHHRDGYPWDVCGTYQWHVPEPFQA